VGGLLLTSHHTPQADGGTQVTTLAPLYDFNGNVLAYADVATSTITHQMEYDPFGQELSLDTLLPGEGAAEAPRFRFSTKYTDGETGLVYYGFRYYSPELGRWPSRDPIEERGGINLYGMVGNDAVNQVDVLGQFLFGRRITQLECDNYCKGHCRGFGAKVASAKVSQTTYNQARMIPTGFQWVTLTAYNCECECAGKCASPFPTLPPGHLLLPPGFRPPTQPNGNYHNPDTGESIRPDNHEPPILPHYDYKDSNGVWWRIFPQNGQMYPKI
jgi:RHS repeat-associated protein